MQTCSVRNSDVCLIQITDCHLLADPDARLGGWNNWAALQAIFEDIRRAHPQPSGLLLTGDLAHDESPEAYQRLDALVMEWRVPVFALPGNHDDPEAMRLHMPKVQVTGSAQIGAWRLQLLDSHVDGQDSGQLGCNQLTHIEAELAQNQQSTLIAVHHPPAPVGSAWIDALGLHDGAELLKRISQHKHVRAIVSGHVHQACDFVVAGSRLLTTPAVTRQFLPHSTTAAEDDRNSPGYRCFQLSADGLLRTQVHRVPEARRRGLGLA